jgi:hypothetical protein
MALSISGRPTPRRKTGLAIREALGNLLQAFNEGLVLSTKAGVDPVLMLDILDA